MTLFLLSSVHVVAEVPQWGSLEPEIVRFFLKEGQLGLLLVINIGFVHTICLLFLDVANKNFLRFCGRTKSLQSNFL